jgi:uncharacterized protein YdhG (YjbR/CyaY superfamily)
MATLKTKPKDIDEYITRFTPETQEALVQIRATIQKIIPDAEETISYGIPTFNWHGTYLIYFAAYKKHISFYPVPSEIEKIGKEYSAYKTSGKGTLQFPLNKKKPLNLVAKLVRFKVKERLELEKKKHAKKTSRG